MNLAVQISLFMVLIGNTLTLSRQFWGIDFYTVDFALLPFAASVVLWAILNLRQAHFRTNLFDLLVAVVVVLVVVSQVFSVNRATSLSGTMDWVRLGGFYFLCRLVVGRVVTERQMAVHFVLVAAFLLGLGLLQTITGSPIGLVANYVGANRGDFFWYRVSGPTPNSNMFAMWLNIFGGFLLSILLGRGRVIALLAIWSAMAAVIVATQSRGGALGFILITLSLAWYHRVRLVSPTLVLGGLALAAVATLLVAVSLVTNWESPISRGVNALVGRQASISDFAEGGERRALMETGFDLLQSPKVFLVGCGSHAMVEAALARSASLGSQRLETALATRERLQTGVHNVWIATAVENGVGTSLALLALFVLAMWKTFARGAALVGEDRVWSAYVRTVLLWYMLAASQVYLMAARLPVLLPIFLILACEISRGGAGDRASGNGYSNEPLSGAESGSRMPV